MNAIMAGALMALTIMAPATAADSRGMMTGGGVGAVGCPEFLNAMATARQHGGARTVAGVKGLDAYIQSYRRKLVTARIGKAAYRGGA